MSSQPPVVFVHGLWIHSSSWQPWMDLFRSAGHDVSAPGWPAERPTAAETRQNPGPLAGFGIKEVTQAYERHISNLPERPIVIGHSFGGLIAQKLLASGHAAAAVAIDPAAIKGVTKTPLRQIRGALPVLSNPRNRDRAVALKPRQFAYSFGNALPRSESDALYERFAIPGSARLLFEAVAANKTPDSPAAVDSRLKDRGPLLMIAGGRDNTVPEVVVRAAHELYRGSGAVTDLAVFPDRGHSLVFDSRWREVADRAAAWLSTKAAV
jgi:non-heme chloroperoxidase